MERLRGGASVEGVTGRISFDGCGDSMIPWAGLNVQNRTMVPVFLYTPSSKELATAAESSELQPIVWPGRTTTTPSDEQGMLSEHAMPHRIWFAFCIRHRARCA